MSSARILLDLRAAQDDATPERGLRRWVRGLADALARRPEHTAALLLDPRRPPPMGLSSAVATSPLLLWNSATGLAAALAAAPGPAVYLIGSPFEHQPPVGLTHPGSLVPEHVAVLGLPVMAVLHDLIPLGDRAYLGSASAVRRYAEHARAVGTLDHLVTNSEHTRQDALARLDLPPSQVTTVGTGVDPAMLAACPDSTIAGRQWGDDGTPVVLCVAGDDDRKNVPGLLRAWARVDVGIRRSRRLLLVARITPATRSRWLRLAGGLGLGPDDLALAGAVDDDGLLAAYGRAELVVMPSFTEGFGLPVAEAVAQRRPVVTSTGGALPEVLDLPESTFDPADPDDIARVITAALTDADLRVRILRRVEERRPTITWDHVADRVLAVADRLTEGRPARRRPRRLRVGLVGPLPPTRSGIAEHNATLIGPLSDGVELVAFATETPVERAGDMLGCEIHAAADLGRRIDPYSFDMLVCCLGNSSGHEATLAVATEVPSLLWLHEVRLPALYLAPLHGRADAAEMMLPLVRRMYGGRTPGHAVAGLGWSVQGYAEAGLGLTRDLVGAARGVVVTSRTALRLLAADQPPHRRLPPSFVVPLAAPPLSTAEPGSHRTRLVAAAGVVAHHKQPERLIDAIALLAGDEPDVRLRFVGDVVGLYREELEQRARLVGVADRVSFTGHVTPDRYRSELAAAGVAVQLRRSSYGEASAAVLDALALGVPVLTNLASATGLPPGTVEPLPAGARAADIAARLRELWAHPGRMAALANAGQAYAASRSPETASAELLAAIEAVLQVRP